LNIIQVYNTFIKNYNTKGNMKLLAETFQRKLIINDLKKWFTANITRFTGGAPVSPPSQLLESGNQGLRTEGVTVGQSPSRTPP
jgi:hypothetical protein